MPTLYNALYIHERQRFGPAQGEADLSDAVPYWQKLLECEDEQAFLSLLERHYHIDLSFLRRHFSEGAGESNNRVVLDSRSFNWVDTITGVWTEWMAEGNSREESRATVSNAYEQVMEGTNLSDFPFHTFYEPFVKKLYADLFHGETAASKVTVQRLAKHDLIQYYLDLLYVITHKTLMLEINYLRQEGRLEGESPEQRYHAYVTGYLENEQYLNALLDEYSVMFRLMAEKTMHLKQFVLELFAHLDQDQEELKQRFGVAAPDIIRLHLGKGDSHRQGRTVVILEFACGTKLVYKPRSMGIDHTFQQFLQWMNDSIDDDRPLYTAGVFDRKTYGWMEFIPYKACESDEERHHFYYRLGKLLAVLHIMNATDFHYENIIASSDHPVLVDLESLFQHTVSQDHEYTDSGAINRALTLIRDSVLSTGVVPMNIDQEQAFDISGIGAFGEQQSPFRIQTLAGKHTDEIHLVKQFGKLGSGQNNPLAGSDEASPEIMHYLDDLLDGFQSGYSLFLTQRHEASLELERFRDCEIRKILKMTMLYSKLLHLSYHPDFMRNQLDRELLLNRISLGFDDLDRRIVRAEIADLLEGDIPYFSSIPSAHWIQDSRDQKIHNFFHEDGLTRSLRKLSYCSEEDLEYQLRIIQSTIAAVYAKEDIKLVNLSNWKVAKNEPIDLVEKAKVIADTLIHSAIKHEGDQGLEYCWTSMVTKGGRKHVWHYSVTGPGIYDGNPGVALFFAQLWRVSGEDKYREACLAAIRPIQLIIEDLVSPDHINLGGFLGMGGIAYGFAQLGAVLNDPAMKLLAERLLREMPRHIQHDRLFDLIGGSAGALAVIANILEQQGKKDWLVNIGEQLVTHLLQHAVHMESGIAWKSMNSQDRPYIGFSHGNAGIIFALCRFMPWSGQQAAIAKGVEEAIEYESRFYDSAVHNWFSEHLDRHSIAWCHGAPGILLSRLEAARCQIAHEHLERDIQSALLTTLDVSLGTNFSFCHGNLGNLDALMLAASYVHPEMQSRIEAKKHDILDDLFRQSEAIHADINTIGVMNGLASIGYGLLRLHDPQGTPSLLTLEIKEYESLADQSAKQVG